MRKNIQYLVAIIATVGLFTGCAEKVSQEQQKKNQFVLEQVKDGSIIICKGADKREDKAMKVNFVHHPHRTVTGNIIRYGVVDFRNNNHLSLFDRSCVSLQVINDKQAAAELVGRVLLGLEI